LWSLDSDEQNVSWNDEKTMRNTILKNVNLCVENLSKILSETYSDNEDDLTTLPNPSSIISPINNNNNSTKKLIPSIREDIYENIHSKLFQVCFPLYKCIGEFETFVNKEDKEMSHIFSVFSSRYSLYITRKKS
jgi:hypothetical protein